MTKEEAKKLFEEVKANSKALEECVGPHQVETIRYWGESKLPKRVKCKLCGGEIDAMDFHWYEKGLEHGRSTV